MNVLTSWDDGIQLGHGFTMILTDRGEPASAGVVVGLPLAIRSLPDELQAHVHRPMLDVFRILEKRTMKLPELFPVLAEAVDLSHARFRMAQA